MHWFIHGSAGVLAANYWPERPELAFAASFASHYLIDWIPHKDPGIASIRTEWNSPEAREFRHVCLPDFFFTAAIGLILPWLVPLMPYGLTAGCVVASILPDAIDGIVKVTGLRPLRWHLTFHNWIHYDHYRHPVHWGWNVFIHTALFAAIATAVAHHLQTNGLALHP